MSRLVREVRASHEDEDPRYATPDGGILEVPRDFAFADTVVALEEEIPTAPLSRPPPSQRPSQRPMTGPPGPWGELADPPTLPAQLPMALDPHAMGLDPYGHPLPMIAEMPANAHDPGLVTRSRSAFERARTNVATARHEMRELWGATYDESRDARLAQEEDPFVRLAGKIRRLRNMWSFFEWDESDKIKAIGIGIGVFAIVALAFFLTR